MAVLPVMTWAQFAPAAGQPGTTAMHADSSALVAWATGCVIERGPMQIDNPSLGMATFGTEQDAIGARSMTHPVAQATKADESACIAVVPG